MTIFKKAFYSSVLLILLLVSLPNQAFAESILPWTSTSSLPYIIASHTSFSYNNLLYVVSGSAASGDSKKYVQMATISSDGTISNWSQLSQPLPEGLIWHTTATKDQYVYILGGREENPGSSMSVVNKTYVGVINDLGSIPTWTLVTPLPKNLGVAGAVVVGDRLYVSGGFGPSNVVNDQVYFAIINADGSLGTWNPAGTLPKPLFGHGMVENNGTIYIIGGRNFAQGYSSDTYKTSVQEDGSLGNWEALAQLPFGIARGGVVKVDNKIISVGGEKTIGITDKVFSSEIVPDGTLNSWIESSNPLPQTVCCGSLAASGSMLYYAGGYNGSGYIDTVYFTKLNVEPDPDPEPEPDPTTIELPVTLLKQTSPPWENKIYDSANLWSPTKATINRWGCALTSATMVLQYHGLQKITNKTVLNPETLNTWLKNQPDGYIRNGLINWLAISRLSKSVKSFNPAFTFDALEYQRSNGMDSELLNNDLIASQPGILEQPGHFIVAKGITSSSISIHDPYYTRETLEDGYNNEYLSLGRYTPSHTDLSYIMLVVNPDVTISLQNNNGDIIGEDFIQDPIIDPVTGNKSGLPLKIVYGLKPESGTYKIVLSSSQVQTYDLDVYLYDKNGNVKKFTYYGMLDGSGENMYPISFNKDSVNSSSIKNIVTFTQFYKDIKNAYDRKLINGVTYLLLTISIKDIENDYKKGKKTQAIKKIDVLEALVKKFTKKEADEKIRTILFNDLQGLREFVKG